MKKAHGWCGVVLAAALLGAGVATAPAAQVIFLPAEGDFNVGANWDTGSFPGQGDFAIITNSRTAYISNTPPNNVAEVWVGNGANQTGTLVQSAGALGVSNWFLVGRSGGGASYGTYNLSGGSITKNGSGGFYVGDIGGSVGTLNLSGTGQIINNGVGAIQIGNGNSAAGGTGTLYMAGTSQLHAGKTNLFLGYGQNALGTLDISGGTVIVGRVFMGLVNASANGLLYLSGGTMWKTGGQVMAIGADAATGRVTQSGGTMLISNGFVSIGYNGNGRGFYGLNGGLLASGNGQDFNLSDQSGTRGHFTIGGGTALVSRLFIAKTSNTVGTLVQSGGVFRLVTGGTTYEPPVGGYGANDWSSYGSIRIEGGYFEVARNMQIGAYGRGSLEINNGTMAHLTGAWPVAARRAGSYGVVTVNGGLWQQQGVANHFIVGELGTAMLNIRGTGVADGGTALWIGNGATATGTVNLAGGVLLVPGVTEGNAAASSALNFHGGILRTKADSATFLQGVDAAYVYGEGAVIDSAGYGITASQNLLAPDGDGVTSIPVTAGGAGYNGPPFVLIAGGDGAGATAIAQVDAGAVTNIIITNPGRGYTSAPTVTLLGGGGSNVTFGTITLGANTSGGLSKQGAGTLTLTGANTFTGKTVVAQGTMLYGSTNSIGGSGDDDILVLLGAAVGTTGAIDQVFLDRIDPGSTGTVVLAGDSSANLDFGLAGLAGMSLGAYGSYTYSGTYTPAGSDYWFDCSRGFLTVSSDLGGAGSALDAMGNGPGGGLVLNGNNTYDGATTISNTILRLPAPFSLPGGIGATGGSNLLTLANGVVELADGDFTRPLGIAPSDVTFSGGGGFAALGADRIVNLGGATSTLTWADGLFLADGSPLILGTTGATHTLTFENGIDLAGAARTVAVSNGAATLDAVLPGLLSNGGLTKAGAGRLQVGDANTYAGITTIAGGSLIAGVLANGGSPSSIGQSSADAANLVLAGGTLEYTGPSVAIDRGYTVSGVGSGLINTNDLSLSGGVVANNPSTFTKAGAGTLRYANSGANTLATGAGLVFVVDEGAAVFDGGPTADYAVTGEIAVGTRQDTSARLDISNGTVRATGFVSAGRGNGALGLASEINVLSANLICGSAAMGYAFNTVNYLAKPSINLYGTATMSVGSPFYVAESGGGWATLNVNEDSKLFVLGDLAVGRLAGSRGRVNLSGNAQALLGRVWLGAEGVTNAEGVIYQSGGWLTTTGAVSVDHFSIGRATNSHGAYMLSGGAVTAQEVNVGYTGYGLWRQTGGETKPNLYYTVGRNTGTGAVLLTGGTLHAPLNNLYAGWAGRGDVTVDDGGLLSSPSNNLMLANAAASVGIVSFNGGTAQVRRVTKLNGTGYVNFNGGTLMAGDTDAADFLQGLNGVFVHTGGAAIDTAGRSITIAQNLVTPLNNNLSSITVTAPGDGYISPPVVLIDGDGSEGAAVAEIDPALGTVTNIIITSPGRNYSAPPTIALYGGGGSNAAATAAVAANPSGGLSKNGAGTLTLAGANTYQGTTYANAGRLDINGSVAGSAEVAAGATLGGTGTVVGTVTAIGAVAPGVSPGVLTVGGDFYPAATAALDIELGGADPGTGHDQLKIVGSAALNGALTVTLTNSFSPAFGQSYTVLTAAIVSGQFSQTNLPALPDTNLVLQYTQTVNEAVLLVASNAVAPPPPYDQWVALYGISGGPEADQDGDLSANLIEYASGSNPTNPASVAIVGAVRTGGLFWVTFSRNTNATDVSLFPEVSFSLTNGATWTPVAQWTGGSWGGALNVNEALTGSPAAVAASDTNAVGPVRYMRLRVTKP